MESRSDGIPEVAGQGLSSSSNDFDGYAIMIDRKGLGIPVGKLAGYLAQRRLRSEDPFEFVCIEDPVQPAALSDVCPSLMHEEKLSWAIAHNLIEDFQLKNETFAFLAGVYAVSAREVRTKFLAQAEATYKPDSEEHERYELFNLLSWLQSHAPDCDLVAERLKQIQEKQPQ